jgi:hypothetical protein
VLLCFGARHPEALKAATTSRSRDRILMSSDAVAIALDTEYSDFESVNDVSAS